jgi:hypothetical protein
MHGRAVQVIRNTDIKTIMVVPPIRFDASEGQKVKLSLCLTKYYARHECVWRSGCIDPSFLDLGTNWR